MMRYLPFLIVVAVTVAIVPAGLLGPRPLLWLLILLVPLCALGLWDIFQSEHTLLRNYPLTGHFRWMFEGIRPQIRQYLIESDEEAVPFSREQRSIVYQRAKKEMDKRPFGTKQNVYHDDYVWLTHSTVPKPKPDPELRVDIGGRDCARPYSSSIYNISAMSFGSLGAQAVRALNKGAQIGKFAQDTGEGGISRYHREYGGDLIWEIGSAYFGCRTEDGKFDADKFAAQAADEQVKMIEIKLSQGAKPGHGGVLPAAKITPEIAETRGIAMGRDCISPAWHTAFATPIELMHYVRQLRELAEGKPVGMKLCIGHRWEFLAIVKAMLETGIRPDFITVDGGEGGTGAAPLEFTNHVGAPLREGLIFVRNALTGAGLRDEIRIAAAGKLVTAVDLVWAMGLGADICNSARGFMFALGCVQAQKCHTNHCPTGVTTQDPWRQRALNVPDKALRVANFHRNTLEALGEVIAAAGFEHPTELGPRHIAVRQRDGTVLSADRAFPAPESGVLLRSDGPQELVELWDMARPDSFQPVR